jgi:putative ABC transport system permease protein
VTLSRVSSSFFEVMGVPALLGRTWTAEEDRSSAPVAVVGERLWQRQLHGDRQAIGRTVRLSGAPVTVVGVMPAAFEFPFKEQIWVPLHLPAGSGRPDLRRASIVARLQPGVSLAEAEAALRGMARQVGPDPVINRTVHLGLEPFRVGYYSATQMKELLLLQAAALLVLLIACGNVANLMVTRAAVRRDEIAVSIALGAGRRHIVRFLLLEWVLVAGLGAVLGTTIAAAAVQLLRAQWQSAMGLFQQGLNLDGRVLLFVVAATLLSATLAGLVPALRVWRRTQRAVGEALGGFPTRVGRGTVGRNRGLGVLIGVEAGGAMVLLVGAGLIFRTVVNIRATELGFRVDHVAVFDGSVVAGPAGRYATPAARTAYLDRVISELERIPGIVRAGATNAMPLWGPSPSMPVVIAGGNAGATEPKPAFWSVVDPGFFTVLRIPLVRGRQLDPRDRASSDRVVVVNQTFATRYFGTADPVGARVRQVRADSIGGPSEWATIVGVVGDARHEGMAAPFEPEAYYPAAQRPEGVTDVSVVIRTAGNPVPMFAQVQRALATVDPDVAFASRTLSEIVGYGLGTHSILLEFLGSFAMLALALSAVGIFAVAAFGVAQRTREVGLRLALGAEQHDVFGNVVLSAMRPVAVGVALGSGLALVAARVLEHLLYQTTATDPLTFGTMAGFVLLVGCAACSVPAWRATRIDPIVALRSE